MRLSELMGGLVSAELLFMIFIAHRVPTGIPLTKMWESPPGTCNFLDLIVKSVF